MADTPQKETPNFAQYQDYILTIKDKETFKKALSFAKIDAIDGLVDLTECRLDALVTYAALHKELFSAEELRDIEPAALERLRNIAYCHGVEKYLHLAERYYAHGATSATKKLVQRARTYATRAYGTQIPHAIEQRLAGVECVCKLELCTPKKSIYAPDPSEQKNI